MAQCNFDATNVPQQQAPETVPAGWYPMKIVGSELKPTKDGTGSFFAFELEILDGPFRGRKVFDRINQVNANEQAVRIGQERMSSYCHSTGVIRLQDTQQLHGIPMWIKLSVRNDPSGQYEPQNDVKAIKHINEPPAAANAGASAPPAGAPSFAQPPAPQGPPSFGAPPASPFGGPPAAPPPAAPTWPPQQAPQVPPQAPPPAWAQQAPAAAPPPPAAPPAPPPQASPRINPQPPYIVGDVVNGHQWDGVAWKPYTAPTAQAPASAAPWAK